MCGVGTGGTITGTARYLREQNPKIEVIGADPVGSIYSNEEVHPYLVEGVGEDFWPATYDPSVVDRYVTVSDRDAFLTTRRLAETEGMLVGGSCGLAMHAALEVAAEISDPEAMVAVILPDGGRGYLSKIFNDEWMTQYGFLERSADRTVGDVLRRRRAGRSRRSSSSRPPARARRDLAAARAPRLAAAGGVRGRSVHGRGLGRRARAAEGRDGRPAGHDRADLRRDGAAVPGVSTVDPVREAVELLTGDTQALIVSEHGRPVGIVTRTDLLESLVA